MYIILHHTYLLVAVLNNMKYFLSHVFSDVALKKFVCKSSTITLNSCTNSSVDKQKLKLTFTLLWKTRKTIQIQF